MVQKNNYQKQLQEWKDINCFNLNDLTRKHNILVGWVILLAIFSLGLCVLITITYMTLPHRICHDEIVTQKVEIESIDPYHNNPYGVIKEYNYPNAKIVCESGVEKSAFNSGTYVGKVGQTCLITTTKKVCEIK